MSTIYIDKNRVLIRQASPEKITGKWKEIVDEIIRTCKEHLGPRLISVYIGGSVAHGDAAENKSDVDAYAIVDLPKEEIEKQYSIWVNKELKRIDLLFPFQRGAEMHFLPMNEIGEGKKFQMKVFSTWVYGKDYSDELPEYKLDKETFGRIRVSVKNDIKIAQKELAATENEEEIKKITVWIAKRLIRSTGMLCMWKGDFFTMDIEKLVELVISHYPEQKKWVEELFSYTQNPPSTKQPVLNMLSSFGSWLAEEDERIFGKK